MPKVKGKQSPIQMSWKTAIQHMDLSTIHITKNEAHISFNWQNATTSMNPKIGLHYRISPKKKNYKIEYK